MDAMDIEFTTFKNVLINYQSYQYSILKCLAIFIITFVLYRRLSVRKYYSDQDMTGKTVVITGATAGIGKATATDLARRNARVILACRNIEKANRVANEIISTTGNKNVIVKYLDLASLTTVRKCAEDILKTEEKLHVLINNAGIFTIDKPTTEDGYETVLQSNYLGHFLLTLMLLDLLKKCAPSRIINVSSLLYKIGKLDLHDMEGEKCKSRFGKYARSKFANILFTIELASRLKDSGVTVNVLHPGTVKSDIYPNENSFSVRLAKIFVEIAGTSPEEGAQTTIFLAVDPEVEKITGKYFSGCREEKISSKMLDKALAKKLFETSEKMVGVDILKE